MLESVRSARLSLDQTRSDPKDPPSIHGTGIETVRPVLLEAVVASAMDAIVAVDAEQRVVLFNPAAELMFGCDAPEALGSKLDRFLPRQFRNAHRHFVSAFMTTGDTSRAMGHLRPLAARRADGHEFPIEATISQVSIDGKTFGAAIVRDISARQQAEAERAEILAQEATAHAKAATAAAERDRVRAILNGLPSGVLIHTPPNGAIEFANAACSALIFGEHGSTDRHPVYDRDFRYLRADGLPLPQTEQPSNSALRGERVLSQQLLLQREDGHTLPISAHAAPLRDAAGMIERAIVVIQDVTALRQAEQLKDDFLALISHEFRTPLTAIHGGAHLLANDTGELTDDGRHELLSDVVAESERLDQMLSNILTLANVLGGRLRVATEPVLIAPLARKVATDMSSLSELHQFIVDIAPGLPPVEADPDLLEQVLRNLYENAIKYAPKGGRVRTTAESTNETVTIQVTDEGIGIAPGVVATVFERFRRVGGDPTVRGMGLGLYLSRHLIEAQLGTVSVCSPGLGLGATFAVTLPIAEGWHDAEDGIERSLD
jgi:PAS domain S-box-containing protein